MSNDINHATCRLLQVVIDMLTNQTYALVMEEREAAKAKGERVYDPPSPYRCDFLAVEAAFRAASQAKEMLEVIAADEANAKAIQ